MESPSGHTSIQYYIDQFRRVIDGQPWYGSSARAILSDIDWKIATAQIKPGAHSIVAIVHHMCTWRRYLVEKLSLNTTFRIEVNGPLDWIQAREATPETWIAALELLRTSNNELLAALGNQRDDVLERIVPKEPLDANFTFRILIDGVLQHDVYHLGQIALLKNLLRM